MIGTTGPEIEISPPPSPAERAAILAALAVVVSSPAADAAPRLPAWAAAGRREVVLGEVVKTRGDLETAGERVGDRDRTGAW